VSFLAGQALVALGAVPVRAELAGRGLADGTDDSGRGDVLHLSNVAPWSSDASIVANGSFCRLFLRLLHLCWWLRFRLAFRAGDEPLHEIECGHARVGQTGLWSKWPDYYESQSCHAGEFRLGCLNPLPKSLWHPASLVCHIKLHN
jgi:hypothetical protein